MVPSGNPDQTATDIFTGAGGTPIFYRRIGPSSRHLRALIVLAHGLGEHGGRYENLYHRLLPGGYVFYALDHRGFGRSGGKRGHVDRFTDYLADFNRLTQIAHKAHPELPLVIYGHSMGSLIAMAWAMDGGARIDALVAASPPMGTPRLSWGKAMVLPARLIAALFPGRVLHSRSNLHNVTRDPEQMRRKGNDRLCHTCISVNWIAEFLKTQIAVAENAGKLRASAFLMLVGTADRIVSPKDARAFFDRIQIRDKTIRLYPDYVHELHNDLGRQVPLDDVAQWLDRRVPPVGAVHRG